jgi:HEAT repeat protein
MVNTAASISEIIAGLTDDNPQERREAAQLLGKTGDERAVPALVFALGDKNRGCLDAVMDALIGIGGSNTVAAILPLVTGHNISLRCAALEILENIGRAAPEQIIRLLDHSDATVKVNAAKLLEMLRIKEAAEPLIGCYHDNNPNVRCAVISALGSIGAQEAIDIIRLSLDDPVEAVRFTAIHALGLLRDEASVARLIRFLECSSDACVLAAADALGALESLESVTVLVQRMEDASSTLKTHIMHRLVQLDDIHSDIDLYGDYNLERFETVFIDGLESPLDEIRKSALKGLERCGSARAILPIVKLAASVSQDPAREWYGLAHETLCAIGEAETLIGLLRSASPPLDDGQEKTVELACRVLGHLKEKEAVPVMVRLFKTVSERTRRVIVLSLSGIGDHQAREALIDAVGDVNGHVRSDAAAALREFHDEKTVLALFRALDKEIYNDVQETILDSLVHIGGDLVLEKMREFLFYPDPRIKELAVSSIGRLGDAGACDHLIANLGSEHYQIRTKVIWALGHLNCERIVVPLLHCLNDEHEKVRLAAIDVLRHRSGDEVLKGLIASLGDTHNRVAYKAAEALGSMGDPRAVDAMIGILLKTNSIPLKIVLVRGLKKMADPRGLAVLDEISRDPDPVLREAFAELSL